MVFRETFFYDNLEFKECGHGNLDDDELRRAYLKPGMLYQLTFGQGSHMILNSCKLSPNVNLFLGSESVNKLRNALLGHNKSNLKALEHTDGSIIISLRY